MYRIERQHEGPTRGHWLPVKGATYGTRRAEPRGVLLRRDEHCRCGRGGRAVQGRRQW